MINEFWVYIKDKFTAFVSFLKDTTLGRLSLISGIIVFLIQIGIWSSIEKNIVELIRWFSLYINQSYYNIPIYLWLLFLLWLIIASSFIIRNFILINFVSGLFSDNFNKGLDKWEFGNDSWKIEKEDGKNVLSVQDSDYGGITKRGFNWSDYEFSFETKVIKGSSGWIIRAKNRTKYFMLQLNLDDPDKPLLRPHIRLDISNFPWIIFEHLSINLNQKGLSKPVRLMDWIKVRIIVRSGEIDAYLNGEHAFHIFLPDPILYKKRISSKDDTEKAVDEQSSVSYPVGRVGFRCSGLSAEHSHFRNVRIKPLIL